MALLELVWQIVVCLARDVMLFGTVLYCILGHCNEIVHEFSVEYMNSLYRGYRGHHLYSTTLSAWLCTGQALLIVQRSRLPVEISGVG